MEAQRALLDQLMGADRNIAPSEGKTLKHRWKDRNICQYFICGFCPYDLFVNTKASIGTCSLAHDYSMQKAFSDEPQNVQKPNLMRFHRFIQTIMDDLKERIAKGKKRVEKFDEKKNEEKTINEFLQWRQPHDSDDRDRLLQEITVDIDHLLKRIEELAEEGKVEESKTLVSEIDKLNDEKRKLLSDETTLRIEANTRDKKLKVCEVCGAFLIADDDMNRIESHVEGKQHEGYMILREKLEELDKINFSEIRSKSISFVRERSASKSPRYRRSRSKPSRHSRHSSRRKRSKHSRRPKGEHKSSHKISKRKKARHDGKR